MGSTSTAVEQEVKPTPHLAETYLGAHQGSAFTGDTTYQGKRISGRLTSPMPVSCPVIYDDAKIPIAAVIHRSQSLCW